MAVHVPTMYNRIRSVLAPHSVHEKYNRVRTDSATLRSEYEAWRVEQDVHGLPVLVELQKWCSSRLQLTAPTIRSAVDCEYVPPLSRDQELCPPELRSTAVDYSKLLVAVVRGEFEVNFDGADSKCGHFVFTVRSLNNLHGYLRRPAYCKCITTLTSVR